MTHPLTSVASIDTPVEAYLREVGEVFRVFGHQDSGTTSYGVLVDGRRWFVKPSDDPSIAESLRRALHLNTRVRHPALPRLHNSFLVPGGLALVYEWVPGEVLNDPRFTSQQRVSDPAHPHVRFRGLPVGRIIDALDTIFDVHLLLAESGFVGVGSLRRLHHLRLRGVPDLPLRPRRVPGRLFRPRCGPGLRLQTLHGPRGVSARGDQLGTRAAVPVGERARRAVARRGGRLPSRAALIAASRPVGRS